MISTTERWKLRLEGALGLVRLGRDFRRFSWIHFAFLVFTSLQTTFINTLLLRLSDSSDIVMWYNLLTFVFNPPGTVLAMYFANKKGAVKSMYLGIALFVVMYLMFFGAMNGPTAVFMPIIAALVSLAGGYYWMAYDLCVIQYSTDLDRDAALGFIGVGTGAVSLLMPAVCGWVISAFQGLAGYVAMLAFSLAVAGGMLLFVRRLPEKPVPTAEIRFWAAWKRFFHTPVILSSLWAEFIKGIRAGTFSFYLNLLLFDLVRSEALVGVNTLLVGLASILAYWVLGRRVTPKNRLRYMAAGVTTLLCCTLILFWKLDALTVMLLSVVNSYFNCYILNPQNSIYYAAVQKACRGRTQQLELMGVKSFFLDYGRVFGVLIVMLMPQSQLGSIWSMVLLTLFQYGMLLLGHFTTRLLAAMPEEPGD
ncbi:MAG: MFS transporter [Oscillospiraceae bacterium]|nr:MFS transporter [Oscillospiraceae bacterium]